MESDYFFKRKEDIAFRTVEGTTFLVNPRTKKIFPLDEVGKVLWDNLGEKKDCPSLAGIICNEFDVGLETAVRDISAFLEEMFENELIDKIA